MGKHLFILFSMLWSLSVSGSRQTDRQALQQWQAGVTVSTEAVSAFGLDNCFTETPIPDEVWTRMQGKSYQPNPYIHREDLRHVRLLHWDQDQQTHIGELVCNKLIARKLVSIFRQLYEAHYPIQRVLLPDVYQADDETQMRANNTSCFCYRAIAGSKRLSKHAQGLAVDVNTLYNPCISYRKNGTQVVQPTTAGKYCDRSASFPYKIDHNDFCYKLFREQGFTWGGDWRSKKDYQHFEYSPK